MVRGVPALLFFIPLKHREVGHPQEAEILGVEQLVAFVIFLPRLEAKLPGGQKHGIFRALSLGFGAPAAQNQQVFVSRAGTPADLGHGGWEVALQALGVVIDAQAAFLAEGFEFVTFLAADGTGFRNAHRHQRQAFRREAFAPE